jgi:ferredoxin
MADRYAVLGSGPSSFAVVSALLKSSCSIEVIDASLNATHGSLKKTKKKTVNGNNFSYISFDNDVVKNRFGSNLIQSFAAGGLSTVWGAALHPKHFRNPEVDDFEQELANILPITQIINSSNRSMSSCKSSKEISSLVGTIFDFPFTKYLAEGNRSSLVIHDSFVAVKNNDSQCLRCSRCLSGCPENLIWNSFDSLTAYAKLARISLVTSRKCSRLIPEGKDVFIETVNKSGAIERLGPYSHVFMAVGPAETFRILTDSEILDQPAFLSQTETFYMPILYSGDAKLDQSIGFPQFHLEINAKMRVWIQCSAFSNAHIDLLRNMFFPLKFFPKSLLQRMLSKCLLGIGYIDVENSNLLKLSRLSKGVEVKTIRKRAVLLQQIRVIQTLWHFRQPLRRLSVRLLLPIVLMTKSGSGAHYGNLQSGSENVVQILKQRGLANLISCVDHSSFLDLDVGPVTYTHMIGVYKYVRQNFC